MNYLSIKTKTAYITKNRIILIYYYIYEVSKKIKGNTWINALRANTDIVETLFRTFFFLKNKNNGLKYVVYT